MTVRKTQELVVLLSLLDLSVLLDTHTYRPDVKKTTFQEMINRNQRLANEAKEACVPQTEKQLIALDEKKAVDKKKNEIVTDSDKIARGSGHSVFFATCGEKDTSTISLGET